MSVATIENNDGEIKVLFDNPVKGTLTLEELGIKNGVIIPGGHFRFVLELGQFGDAHLYQMPTIEIAYFEHIGESYWSVDFNGETVLEKTDHSGNKTILLLKRKQLETQVHRHVNELIIHGDFPEEVHLDTASSYIHIF